MAIDLNSLSARELDALISQANKRKKTLKKRKSITEVRSKLAAMAQAEGYSVTELFGGRQPASGAAAGGASAASTAAPAAPGRRGPGRKLGKVAPKYRNPGNPKETWTGRGKQPRWMSALTSKGRKVEDFLIRK